MRSYRTIIFKRPFNGLLHDPFIAGMITTSDIDGADIFHQCPIVRHAFTNITIQVNAPHK
jgi:hypothetical protein